MANYLGKWHAWVSREKNGALNVLYTETANPTLSSSGNPDGFYKNGVFYGYDFGWVPIREIGNNVKIHDGPGVNYNKRTGNYIVIGVRPPLSAYDNTYTVLSYSDDFKPFVIDDIDSAPDPNDPSTWTNTPKYIFKTWDGKTYERIVGQTYYSYDWGRDETFQGSFRVLSNSDTYIEPRGGYFVDGFGIDWIVSESGPS